MYFEVFVTGLGLAMDAFAVAICKGLKMQKLNYKQLTLISLFFGGFQAIMPLIGYFLGTFIEEYIKGFDHWIAFGLLLFIGGKMAYESFKSDDDECCCGKFDIKELTIMAIATSIDALAVGITFATLGKYADINIFLAIAVIGITTFILSAIGVLIGNKFGAVYKSKAELAGGIILILIGIKILLEDLGIIHISLF